jgi:hypothetical protein
MCNVERGEQWTAAFPEVRLTVLIMTVQRSRYLVTWVAQGSVVS